MAIAETATRTIVNSGGTAKEIVGGGAAAGVIGGMLMAMVMMIATASGGMGFLAPLRLIAATFFGQDAMTGAGPLVVGLMAHMMTSIVFGLIFAGVVGRRLPPLQAVMAGVAFGIAIWALMTFLGLPLANPIMREKVATMPVPWFVAHVVFGMGLGAAPGLRRRLVETETRASIR